GDVLTITGLPAHSDSGASLSLDAQGHVVYDPGALFYDLPPGDSAVDTFSYTVTDAHGATSTATAEVVVSGASHGDDLLMMGCLEDETTENYFDLASEITAETYGGGAHITGVDTSTTIGTVQFDKDAGILTYTADDPSQDALYPDMTEVTGFEV